ncbi:DUF6090 family protein [Aequorivita echinoideorum]|uniref:Uncharacterized protein n=1 Tax=Aequorivita echinoideorum TaxID=1549647 RepID=A0ABS5S2F3_9FLAO|nr:DUF6090 family protein [Aequorivita echinoideorum]MBT0607388.1 hypothetical protein [Aequorivita echinoideorum]
MAKIFRNIRYSLLKESRLTRYVVYALGEIILVVIGILIALQLNKWNEYRKNTRLETRYVNRLLDDLKEEKSYVKTYIFYNAQVNEHAKKSIAYFNDSLKAFKKSGSSLVDLYQASQINSARMQNSTYKELVFSGQINLIRSDSLKQSIISYNELNWNTVPIMLVPNKYRESLRSLMPQEIQDQIRTHCGDIYIGSRKGISVRLPEDCQINITDKEAEDALKILLEDTQLKKDLLFLIGNLDSKLAYMNYVLKQLDAVDTQLSLYASRK